MLALGGVGHRAVITPWPLRPAAGGFRIDDFIVEKTARTVICSIANAARAEVIESYPAIAHPASCPARGAGHE